MSLPTDFLNADPITIHTDSTFDLESDKEIGANNNLHSSHRPGLFLTLLNFSKWSSVVQAIAQLIKVAHQFGTSTDDNKECCGWHVFNGLPTIQENLQEEKVIARCVQQEVYLQEIENILKGLNLPKDSP